MTKTIKFEDQMKRLQEIVENLEKDDIDLDKSIELYEEGLSLSKSLKSQLEKFEDKISKINEESNDWFWTTHSKVFW